MWLPLILISELPLDLPGNQWEGSSKHLVLKYNVWQELLMKGRATGMWSLQSPQGKKQWAIGGCRPHVAYSSKDIWSFIRMEASDRDCKLMRVIQGFCRGPESLPGGSDGRHQATSSARSKPSTSCRDSCTMQTAIRAADGGTCQAMSHPAAFTYCLSCQSFVRGSSEQPGPPVAPWEGETSGLSHSSPLHIARLRQSTVTASVSGSRHFMNHGKRDWAGLTFLAQQKWSFTTQRSICSGTWWLLQTPLGLAAGGLSSPHSGRAARHAAQPLAHPPF